MAGIGFAINKVVREKRLTSKPRAFVYASIVTVAPLLQSPGARPSLHLSLI